MAKIVEYQLLTETSAVRLSENICSYLKGGWEPYGEPFFSPFERGLERYCQAVIKREKALSTNL